MNYSGYINSLIKSKILEHKKLVIFGQNIAAASCLSGLTRGLTKNSVPQSVVQQEGENFIINTPNCENTLVGTGFGLMLNGVSSIFCMKQQDFLLLGMDQLVNTYNLIRRRKMQSSFTILSIIVDSGFEGPQSCLNNFADFCSIARIPGYTITNWHDATKIIDTKLVSPGFRIIGVSQRLFRTEPVQIDENVVSDKNSDIFKYTTGDDLTIACFNFSFPQGLSLARELNQQGVGAELFSVNSMLPVKWDVIFDSIRKTGKLVILDDSKSINRPFQHLALASQKYCLNENIFIFAREVSDEGLRPNQDAFNVDCESIIRNLKLESGRPVLLSSEK